ncbi:MAG: diacylglycerol/lipid kinase family protein [Bacillota bacterium]
MRTIYIININAKNNYSISVWERLQKQLSVHKEDIYFTATIDEMKEAISSAVNAAPEEKLFIVGVGGDGTISALINQCITYKNVTVGHFPAGSGNDFAKGYFWPAKAEDGAKVIKLLQKNQIPEKFHDTGYYVVNGNLHGYFVNTMGAGFDAKITQRAQHSPVKKWLNRFSAGKLIYAVLVLSEAMKFKPLYLEAEIDGEKKNFHHTWFITVSNQQFFGGGMRISPKADSADGLLDLTVVHNLSRVKLLVVFLSVFWGKHTSFKEVETFRVKEVLITSPNSVPVQADGDYIGLIEENKKLHIEVQHHNWRTADMNSEVQ